MQNFNQSLIGSIILALVTVTSNAAHAYTTDINTISENSMTQGNQSLPISPDGDITPPTVTIAAVNNGLAEVSPDGDITPPKVNAAMIKVNS